MRSILAASAVMLLMCVSFSNADLREPRPVDAQERVAPMGARTYVGAFKENESASVQLSGNGAASLGLYVFDGDGNCVAMDDVTGPKYCDELRVAWIADTVGRYALTVRNGGFEVPRYNLAIR